MSLRTAVIGLGQIAAGLADDPAMARTFTYATHAQALRDHPEFEWVGVADPAEAAQRAARERWGVPHVAATIGELVRACDPEVAVLTSPPSTRIDAIGRMPSLRAVLVEKPLGTEAEAFLALCQRRGILVQVNFWRRADETLRRLAAGELRTRIGAMQAAFGLYGNGLRNNGGHLVDLVRMLLGDVHQVQAVGPAVGTPGTPIPGDVHVPFALRMASGATVAVAPLDFRHYREVGLDLWGERGRLEVLQESFALHQYPVGPNRGLTGANEVISEARSSIPVTSGMALYRMYDNLAGAVLRGDALWSGGRSALASEAILSAVVASADAGGAPQDLKRAA